MRLGPEIEERAPKTSSYVVARGNTEQRAKRGVILGHVGVNANV